MGSEIRHRGSRPISLHAVGHVPIETVEIVRNGKEIVTLHPRSLEVHWQGEDLGTGGNDWYYARVMHENDEMAWSSPVWVDVA
jgi:hypothetical protein